MSERTSAYAAAILQIGRAEGSLDAVVDELQQIAQAVAGNDQLQNALGDPKLPIGRRLGLIESDVLGAASTGTSHAFVWIS